MYEVTRITTLQITEVIKVDTLEALESTEEAGKTAAKNYKEAHNADDVNASVQYFPRELETRSE